MTTHPGAFKKGQSGNPSGRPKMTFNGKTLTELTREFTLEAIECLAGILRDPEAPPAAKVSAVNILLDRGWGRPSQSVDINANISVEQAGVSEALGWIKDALGEGEQTTH